MATSTPPTEGKKWINTSVVIAAALIAFIMMSFIGQLSEWFELEAKIKYYHFFSQAVSVLIGLGFFIYIVKNPKTSSFLDETYSEVLKVVFPDRNGTVRQSIGIIIGLTIVGFLLGLIDFSISKILSFIH